MNENEESRNKLTYTWPIDFQQKYKGNSVEKRQSFQYMILKQLDLYRQKSEPQPILHITYKNYLKMDHRPKCKTRYYKTSGRKHRRKIFVTLD